MNEFVERQIRFRFNEPKSSYDVVIVGAGGHGLATAYYLAKRHGITNVGVFERSYIGGGNSGRNTTVIRANYGIPEAVRFYQHSLDLYYGLEQETERSVLFESKGLLWLTHSEAGLDAERARASVNQAFGADSELVTPRQVKELCPQIDLTGGGNWPVVGGTYHAQGASARHDRVVWAYAEGAMESGVHVHQRTAVDDLVMDGERVVGVRVAGKTVSAGVVLLAIGGHVSLLAARAGLRLPIRTHRLQAFVTNHYAREFSSIVSSSDLLFYAQQTARGEMLLGAEIDRQPSYNYGSGYHFLQACCYRAMKLLPFLAKLKVLRQWTGVCDMSPDYSPILGETGVDGLLVTTGWGTWGFKAIPAGGEQMAQMIATGAPSELMAPFSLERFSRDRTMADRGSAGTH